MLFNLKRRRVMAVGAAPLCMIPTDSYSRQNCEAALGRREMSVGKVKLRGIAPEALNHNLQLGCWKANRPKQFQRGIPNKARFQVRAPDTKEGLVPIFGDFELKDGISHFESAGFRKRKYPRPLFGWVYKEWAAVFDILFVIDTTPEARMLFGSLEEMGAKYGLVDQYPEPPSLFTLFEGGLPNLSDKYRDAAVRLYKAEPVALL